MAATSRTGILRVSRTERQKREATLNVARAEAKPDLTLNAGPRLLGASHADTSLVAGFSIPLPLLNRNQGKIAEAEAKVAKTSDEQVAAEAGAYAELNEAYQVSTTYPGKGKKKVQSTP